MTCRLHSAATLALTLVLFAEAGSRAGEEISSGPVQTALARAGDNNVQLSAALKIVPPYQSQGMQFLIANMPRSKQPLAPKHSRLSLKDTFSKSSAERATPTGQQL